MRSGEHRCLIVDDSPAFCIAVRGMLESAGIAVVATSSSLATAVAAAQGHQPDIILVDIDLGGESGFDVVEALDRALGPRRAAIILVSTHDQDDFAEMVAASPAIAFLPKFGLTAALILETVNGRGPSR